MREILFRGKSVFSGEWVYGNYEKIDNEKFGFISNRDAYLLTNIIKETVGQYSGLRDKNGKKIFENDIIKNLEDDTGLVQWYDEHSAFMIWCINQNKVYYLWDNDFQNIEVVGNIFDNPELLK